jgi:hypothetical protein
MYYVYVTYLKETPVLTGRAEVCELLFGRPRVKQPAEIHDRDGAAGGDLPSAHLLCPDVPDRHRVA